MKIPALKLGDVVLIRWIDASSHGYSWINETDHFETRPGMEIKTVGIFLEQRDNCIRICGDRHNDPEYIERVNRMLDIPIGCVIKARKLK